MSRPLNGEWPDIERQAASLNISDNGVGINPGDRRALYYLIRYLGVRSVLEIGTSLGASTVYVAWALRRNQRDNPHNSHHLTTVDIVDVNHASRSPDQYAMRHSPKEMIKRIGADDYVAFIRANSLEYLRHCEKNYDMIFLDGDHSAETVCQEIPLALRILSHGGLIVLHDYFPELRPLWSDSRVTPGPWLATQRLRNDGGKFEIVPLGELPWMTKLNSKITSLALLVRE